MVLPFYLERVSNMLRKPCIVSFFLYHMRKSPICPLVVFCMSSMSHTHPCSALSTCMPIACTYFHTIHVRYDYVSTGKFVFDSHSPFP